MATAAPMIDPAQVIDPSLYGQQQIIAQRQALASLLKQKGLEDLPGIQMAGRVAVGNSPVEGLARMAQLLSGQNLQGQVDAQQQNYGQRQAQALQGMFQGQTDGLPQGQAALAAGAAQGSVGPTTQNAQTMGAMPPPQTRPGAMQMPGATSQQSLAAYLLNPEAYGKDLAGAISPNDTTRQALQGNMDPVAANQTAFAKANTDGTILRMRQAGMSPDQINAAIMGEAAKNAEVSRRSGEQFKNFFTNESGIVAKLPDGVNLTGPVGANGVIPGVTPVPGAQPVIRGNALASSGGQAAGAAPYKIVEGFDPTRNAPTKGFAGNLLPPVNAASGAAAQANSKYTPDSVTIMESEAAKEKDPAVQARLMAEAAKLRSSLGMQAGPALGQTEAATGQQKGVDAKWADLNASNSSAQTVIARLQTLKSLAPAAISGAETERRDFYNGLLSMAGMKGATDAKTASDLVDKNAAQIVSSIRMGQGGAGTDALQTLVQSANPNRHMTPAAIQDAVDQLVSVQQMTQAKARILQPYAVGNSRDPAAYSQREVQFDQNADPRIWQYQSITNPVQRKAFAQQLTKQDPTFATKIQSLEKMGAL